MRIIGGSLKGKTFFPPAGYEARPTTDFAKEGLFNILENEINFEDTSLLDLFGGTGSISAEFLSRGGRESLCVEMNRRNAFFIKKLGSALKLNNLKCVHCNVFDFLELCDKKFNLIFADPPYKLQNLEALPDKIFGKEILSKGGYFILEHGKEYNFSNHPYFLKEKRYGNVHFSFFLLSLPPQKTVR